MIPLPRCFPFLAGLALGLASLSAKESVYSKSTLVVYNKSFPDSEALAKRYVNLRGIPAGNVVELECPTTEEISRAEYDQTVAQPIRRHLDKGFWKVEEAEGGKMRATENKVHVLALIRGVPLKIKHGGDPQAGFQDVDSASVDSELAAMGSGVTQFKGWTPNPYFRKAGSFAEADLPEMMLVARLDGPSSDAVRGIIEDSTTVESLGLWGRAYVDVAQLAKEKGPNYQLGDDWLKSVARQVRGQGFVLTLDEHSSRFPSSYPLKDCALYFGWYVNHADGPFIDPAFRFKRGAVACHIHSYSASTVRSDKEHWVGPLVARGAAAVLGNVYEPFLTGTAYLDVFTERLLDGYTLAEAAYVATPSLSWMTVVVGDPLYRPFDGLKTYQPQFYRKDEDQTFKTYRVALQRWGDQSDGELEKNLRNAGANHKTGFYLEALGLRERQNANLDKAGVYLRQAYEQFPAPSDKLRVRLHEVDIERQRGNRDRAVAILKETKADAKLSQAPEIKAVTALLNQLDPPGPATPTPAPK